MTIEEIKDGEIEDIKEPKKQRIKEVKIIYKKRKGGKVGNPGHNRVIHSEVEQEIDRVTNFLTVGIDGKKATIQSACKQLGLSTVAFYNHLNSFPALKDKYFQLRAGRREFLKEASEENINKAITGKSKDLSQKEILDASFRFLEKTDKNYSTKIETENKNISINITKSSTDLFSDLQELLQNIN